MHGIWLSSLYVAAVGTMLSLSFTAVSVLFRSFREREWENVASAVLLMLLGFAGAAVFAWACYDDLTRFQK